MHLARLHRLGEAGERESFVTKEERGSA
eukprot:COSAG04_NODE_22172_length_360_cov_0.593870_1_plen_27_part_10